MNCPVTLLVVMMPFVFSTPSTSVLTEDDHGFVVEAVVVALTELQMLELQPVKVSLVRLPTPVSPLVIDPPASEPVQVTVLMSSLLALKTVRITLPTFLATIGPL